MFFDKKNCIFRIKYDCFYYLLDQNTIVLGSENNIAIGYDLYSPVEIKIITLREP